MRPRSIWSFAILAGIVLVGTGLTMESSRASMFLCVAGILCAAATVVRFVVTEVRPEDMCREDRLAPDEQPAVKTSRRVQP